MKENNLLVIPESLELGGHGHLSTRVCNEIRQWNFKTKDNRYTRPGIRLEYPWDMPVSSLLFFPESFSTDL